MSFLAGKWSMIVWDLLISWFLLWLYTFSKTEVLSHHCYFSQLFHKAFLLWFLSNLDRVDCCISWRLQRLNKFLNWREASFCSASFISPTFASIMYNSCSMNASAFTWVVIIQIWNHILITDSKQHGSNTRHVYYITHTSNLTVAY